MLLVFDIGNSAVKGAIFDGSTCVQRMHFSAEEIYSPTGILDGLTIALDEREVTEVGFVSVVPQITDRVRMAVQIALGLQMTGFSAQSEIPITINYDTPETLGADRIASVVAAHSLFGLAEKPARSVIVIDAGTAVTCDVVSAEGVYQGGSIGAGPRIIGEALASSTAQLPAVDLEIPPQLPPRSTKTAVQAGIMYGFLDAVDGMAGRLSEMVSDDPLVVATGGWADWLNEHSSQVDRAAADVVLEGVRLLMEHAASKKES